ncbi:hypothetical protein Agub_g6700, partial [Astrephomene gubernaculifera]
ALLLESQQAVQERDLQRLKELAASASSSGATVTAAATAEKRAAAAVTATLEALTHVYGELDEMNVVAAARRRLLLCPGSFTALAAEAAGRPRLAVRRLGQLAEALERLKARGPAAASERVPEGPHDEDV